MLCIICYAVDPELRQGQADHRDGEDDKRGRDRGHDPTNGEPHPCNRSQQDEGLDDTTDTNIRTRGH